MALTGNTVQSTYLDLVQLEKSGAGLPSHAGKEAAVYDGSGAQILGRTAVRHWLDPDPDAISGSYEFSTMGDMTQGQLETAGWTFSNYTASVTGGMLALYKTAAYDTLAKAEATVSLSGDFDFVIGISPTKMDSLCSAGGYSTFSGLYVADSSGSAHGVCAGGHTGTFGYQSSVGSTYANLASGTLSSVTNINNLRYLRVYRNDGTVYVGFGTKFSSRNWSIAAAANTWSKTSAVDSSTFDKLILVGAPNGKTSQNSLSGYNFIRRYL